MDDRSPPGIDHRLEPAYGDDNQQCGNRKQSYSDANDDCDCGFAPKGANIGLSFVEVRRHFCVHRLALLDEFDQNRHDRVHSLFAAG